MSNIYEALEQVQREKAGSGISPLTSSAGESHEKGEIPEGIIPFRGGWGGSGSVPKMDAEMYSLYQHIDCLLPDFNEKTILFTAPQGGEGVSTIVREFARMATARLNKMVLIVDAAHHNPTMHLYFGIKAKYGWRDVMENGEPVDKACYRAGKSNLFLSPVSPQHSMTPQTYDHDAVAGFLNGLKEKFDLILIDSSPAMTSPDSVALSRFSDGVVLVAEAERTRWQLIEGARDRIDRKGGNLLGIIFNKRRYHIPEFIYKWL